MRFLADDLLEGRETGTRGYDIAAQYVAAQFEAAGLQPPEGGWLQRISFRSSRVTVQEMAIDGAALTPRKDFIFLPSFERLSAAGTAPVVHAGFGIIAPELHRDDYAGIDVRGRIVLILTGAPASYPTDQRAYYAASTLKIQRAAERGAVAVLFLNSRTDDLRVPFERRVQQDGLPAMRYLDAHGNPADPTDVQITGRISAAAAARLFARSGFTAEQILRDAEKELTHSMVLKAKATLHAVSEFSSAMSANVVGTVRGSDAAVRSQYVVVSAHLDHLGNHPRPGTSDAIYNGAQDDASGIACLIEIARAVAKRPARRSVLFVAFTGEEKGEQGSRYFARNPPVSKKALVADINMDMPVMLYPFTDVIALGGEHSALGDIAQAVAREEHLKLSPDPLPQEVRFIRSDQFSFVQAGIPAIHMKIGVTSANPRINGAAVMQHWLRTIYHTPADDMQQPIDFAAGARYAALNLRLVRATADAPQRVDWKRGDFFTRTFAFR